MFDRKDLIITISALLGILGMVIMGVGYYTQHSAFVHLYTEVDYKAYNAMTIVWALITGGLVGLYISYTIELISTYVKSIRQTKHEHNKKEDKDAGSNENSSSCNGRFNA